ncbi:phosphoenolpyruvate carboxylase kinase 1-like [Chenopodium quinoa]|nr:phosphoenolpyruvate carboxylase kinase 1-like [Chenopodium quinoa]
MLSRDYEIIEEIGSGRFGVVSKCKSRFTGEFFAVKSIAKSSVSGDTIDSQSLINEPKALLLLSLSSTSSSSSSYITRLHSTYDTPSHLHLILDFFPFPSLYDVVSRHHRIPEPESRSIIFSLLHAILHCHQNGVVHRDIKPDNILFDPVTKRVKLCDFGSSGFVNDGGRMNEVVGTPYYVAPEILEGNGYDEKVDVWSVGVVLYVILAGIPPFYGERVEEVFEKVLRGNLRFPSRVFGNFSPAVKDLLRKMICKDVSRRFSAQEALRHPWFMANGGQPTTMT